MSFIGREGELAHLSLALQRAAEGDPTRVVITGAAGAGVSTLLGELRRRLSGLPGVVVAWGRAYEPLSGVPFHALTRALEPVFARLPDDRVVEVVGTAGHDLAGLLPGSAARLDALGVVPPEPLVSAPDQRVSRLTESVIGALERLARRDAVVLLILEDLHWADQGTRAFVETLLRTRRSLPLCVVVTYQPEQLHPRHPMRGLADVLASTASVDRLGLSRLERDDLVRLLRETQGERASAGLIAAIAEGSAGNPLLVKHLVAAHASVEGLRLSDRFEELMHARLEPLSRAAVRCLQILAAVRRPIARREIASLPASNGHLSAAAFGDVLDSGLAVTLDYGEERRAKGRAATSEPHAARNAGDAELLIAHDLYADAIEALISPPDRQLLHGVLARDLEAAAPERAWHWERAVDFVRARDAHIDAARNAEALDPGATTLLHYQRALELVGPGGRDDGSDADMARLLADAAEAAFVSGAYRRAAVLAERALARRRARRGADARLEAGLLYERLGRYRWAAGDLVPALTALQQAADAVPGTARRERARVLGSLAQHLMLEGRFEESARVGEEARRLAVAAGEEALAELGHVICTLGVDRAYAGDLQGGLHLLEEATELSRRAGRLEDVMRGYANRTVVLDLDARRERILEVLEEGTREARRWGLEGVYGAFLRGNAAEALLTLGRWREAEAAARAAMEWAPSGVAFFAPLLFLGVFLVESRADDEAVAVLGRILLELETVPAGQWTAMVQRAAVSLALWRGDLEDAQRAAERGWDRVLQTNEWSQIALSASTTLEACAASAEASRERRDWEAVADAGELAQRVVPEAERRVAAAGIPRTLGSRREADLHVEVARAHLGRVRGHSDPKAWRRLARAWSAFPVPYQAAKARWWEAIAWLQARDHRTSAGRALHEAWRIAVSLPARPLQRELATLARRGRIQLPTPTPVEPDAGEPTHPPRPARNRMGDLVAIPVEAREGVALPVVGDTAAAVAIGPSPTAGVDTGRDVAGGDPPATLREPAREGAHGAPTSATRDAIEERLATEAGEMAPDPFGLSPREREVLLVLAEGRTNREIAERLFISERTVAVHVRRILQRLGVSGRVEAATVAVRLGLISRGRNTSEMLAQIRRR